MIETMKYPSGWQAQPRCESRGTSCASWSVVAVASAMLIGTGGQSTLEYLAKRGDRGYAYYQITKLPGRSEMSGQRTASETLVRVREVLKPAVSDLASLLGVSRQTIYDWQSGAQPTADKAARLDDLAQASDVLVEAGVAGTPRLLQRQISGGKTLLDIVREGGSGKEAAHKLASIVRVELEQRRALDSRLAGRKHQPVDFSSAGAPVFDGDTT